MIHHVNLGIIVRSRHDETEVRFQKVLSCLLSPTRQVSQIEYRHETQQRHRVPKYRVQVSKTAANLPWDRETVCI